MSLYEKESREAEAKLAGAKRKTAHPAAKEKTADLAADEIGSPGLYTTEMLGWEMGIENTTILEQKDLTGRGW